MIHAGENVPVVLEDNVTVGHACILHGCTVRNTSIIGMGSILMNHSCIGSHCIVGAGSLVTENKVFPDCSLIMGRPARWIRSLTQEEIQKCEENARHYLLLAKQELEQREM